MFGVCTEYARSMYGVCTEYVYSSSAASIFLFRPARRGFGAILYMCARLHAHKYIKLHHTDGYQNFARRSSSEESGEPRTS